MNKLFLKSVDFCTSNTLNCKQVFSNNNTNQYICTSIQSSRHSQYRPGDRPSLSKQSHRYTLRYRNSLTRCTQTSQGCGRPCHMRGRHNCCLTALYLNRRLFCDRMLLEFIHRGASDVTFKRQHPSTPYMYLKTNTPVNEFNVSAQYATEHFRRDDFCKHKKKKSVLEMLQFVFCYLLVFYFLCRLGMFGSSGNLFIFFWKF